MLNAFNYSNILWRIEGYVRGILFCKQFTVRPYISTRTKDEAQNVAIHLELSWMSKEDGVRGLAADLATFLT